MPAEEPKKFRYFLDYDEETNSTNVFAAVTNFGMFGYKTEKYGIEKDPEDLFRDPNARLIQGGTELSGYGAVFPRDNSSVNWCGANPDVLGPEVPEDKARKIHPTLFKRKRRDEEREAQNS